MNIEDFLPKYPNIYKSEYDLTNFYETNIYDAIFHKKEFYDNRLERTEVFPKERGQLTKYQKTITQYMSSHTPYDGILLIHAMGSGKTCSAIGSIEQIRRESSLFTGAIIIAKGKKILDNFKNELVFKCTDGIYIPENFSILTAEEKVRRINKKVSTFYKFDTYDKFSKQLRKMSKADIHDMFSNHIIVLDEVHNLRFQDEKGGVKKDVLQKYEAINEFLHTISNKKVILLSGTPMKDTVDEIASVMNLLLPKSEQLPIGSEFKEEYMEQDEDRIWVVRPEKVKELKTKFRGKISFLRDPYSSVKTEFLGKKRFGRLNHFTVQPLLMSSFQSKHYIKSYLLDTQGQHAFYIHSREASLFVYPDGSYGRDGFKKYIVKRSREGKKTVYRLSDELKEKLKPKGVPNTQEDILNHIRKYSILYYTVIKKILETKGNCFVFSSLVEGSGAILFSLLLELFDYSKASGGENTVAKRYAILTNKTTNDAQVQRIVKTFNRPENYQGDYIQVAIGSKTVSEGISFKNVVFESINTPYFHYSETSQALARGIRLGSHNDLIMKGIVPKVDILQAVSIPIRKNKMGKYVKINKYSVDLLMYKISENKDISIRKMLYILLGISMDCALNYKRNFFDGQDGERQCFYSKCRYTCDGVADQLVENGIPTSDLDYSTYQLYYANPRLSLVRERIENLLQIYRQMSFESLVHKLSGEFSPDDIYNALELLREEEKEKDEVNYTEYMKLYSRSEVQKIIAEVESLYRSNFSFNLKTFEGLFPNNTKFEILTALRQIIVENRTIYDRYGFPCYLREDRDVFFLVNSLDAPSNYLIGYYTNFPTVLPSNRVEVVRDKIASFFVPKIVQQICNVKDYEEFSMLIKKLPPEIAEMIVQATLTAKDKGVERKENLMKFVQEYFKSHIRKINDTWVLTMDANNWKCKEKNTDWRECEEKYYKLLSEKEEKKMEDVITQLPHGIVGKYNPENKKFCLLDTQSTSYLKGEKSKDTRRKVIGKVCTSWIVKDLRNVAINRIRMKPPDDYRKDDDEKDMIQQISKMKSLNGIVDKNTLNMMDRDELRLILYWAKTNGNSICDKIKEFFEKQDLLIYDDKCGSSVGGKTKGAKQKEKQKKKYMTISFTPEKTPDKFRQYRKALENMRRNNPKHCDGNIQLSEKSPNKMFLVFTLTSGRKSQKPIAFVIVDKHNAIVGVCVVPKHWEKDTAPMILQDTIIELRKTGVEPTLIIGKHDDAFLKEFYGKLGFKSIRTDQNNIELSYAEAS